ncbi:antitoxin Xre/MbcA/ParS toxin-binding domain-containing protein [Thaumasiovibrio sp. DFM-14]|uniref:antitoxin Xre/MbcA/ParS toxin-binding domain-containing protein n=1 Tax=Thaumasiovibrio sp. DFM-14 TaxID=3384792 RepID=UPI0039A3E44D
MNKETKKNFDKVFQAALALFGSENAAHRWLQTPVRGLGNKRPIDMLSTTEDTEVVLDLIGRLEHGVF